MNPTNPPTRAPIAAELLANTVVQAAMQQAWIDSQVSDAANRHEEGGWIDLETMTGQISIRRAPSGTQQRLDLGDPPVLPGSVVVGTFHTHPNPTIEGWEPGPSPDDQFWSNVTGVPWLIQADDGTHATGPVNRRGGSSGNPGFPS
jgi:hypothetical protein